MTVKKSVLFSRVATEINIILYYNHISCLVIYNGSSEKEGNIYWKESFWIIKNENFIKNEGRNSF